MPGAPCALKVRNPVDVYEVIKAHFAGMEAQAKHGAFMVASEEQVHEALLKTGASTWRSSLTKGQRERLLKHEALWRARFKRSSVGDSRAFFHLNDDPSARLVWPGPLQRTRHTSTWDWHFLRFACGLCSLAFPCPGQQQMAACPLCEDRWDRFGAGSTADRSLGLSC